MSPFFCIKGCKLVSVPVKFILTEFKTGNENMFSYEEKISLIKKFYERLKVLEPCMLRFEMDYSDLGTEFPKFFGNSSNVPESYFTIVYIEDGFGEIRIDINFNDKFIEWGGHFSCVFERSTSSQDFAFLENRFKRPLAPTEIEIEEFHLEHGCHYLLNSNLELVDPLTGEIV